MFGGRTLFAVLADPLPNDPLTGTWRLKQIGLARLLHNLAINERTGTLVLKRGEVSKSIFFKNGYVMFAESNLATDRLGEVLCRRGEITRSQLSECLAESKKTGKMLGAVLVEKQVLRAERLLPAIEVQVREIVLGAFAWDDGEYLFSKEFFGNTEDLLDLKIRTADLILEGVRRTYTAAQASRTLGDVQKPPRLSAESGYLSQDLTVSFEVSKVLSKVDGARTIQQIVVETGLTELAVLQILAALAHLKIVDSENASGSVAPMGGAPAATAQPAGSQDVRVRAARVEEMRAHDEVTQLLDKLPPLVSQLAWEPSKVTPAVLQSAGPGAEQIGKSFGGGRRILDVLQERNYTLELVRAVAALYNAGALKQVSANTTAPSPASGWTPAPASAKPAAGSAWQVPATPGGGISAPPWTGGAKQDSGGFPAAKGGLPPPAGFGAPPPAAAGFPATKDASAASGGFPAPKNEPTAGFPAAKGPGNGGWGAPLPPPAAGNAGAPSPSPWDVSSNAPIPVGPAPSPIPAPAPAPVPAPSASPWAAPPASVPPAGGAPSGWGAPVAPPPTPAASPSPWGAPPAAPSPSPASRPAGPSVWNVPSAASPPSPAPTPAPAPATFAPSPAPAPMPWGTGATTTPSSPSSSWGAPPPPRPAPAPGGTQPMGGGLDVADLSDIALEPIEMPIAKGKASPSPLGGIAPPEPIPGERQPGLGRRLAFLGLGIPIGAGAVAGLAYFGILAFPGSGATVDVTPTPVAVVTATSAPTEAPTQAPTATVAATTAPPATPAPTATPAATATPASTKVAVAATPAPTPDEAAKKKKAAGLVKQGESALNGGDGPKAIKLFGQAIALDPKNPKAHLGLGGAYMVAGENAKAKKSFQKFLELAPNDPLAEQTRQILGSL